QHDVVLGDAADALVDDVDAHLWVLDLRKLRDRRLDRADHVALEHEVEVANRAGLELLEQVLDRHAARRLRELLASQPFAAHVREVPRTSFVLDDTAELAGGRRLVEAEDLDWVSGTCLFDLVPAEIV